MIDIFQIKPTCLQINVKSYILYIKIYDCLNLIPLRSVSYFRDVAELQFIGRQKFLQKIVRMISREKLS